jgi:hypothetical protein
MTPSDMTDSDEIDLWQMVEFVVAHAKFILASGLAGAVLAVGGWFLLAPYKADLVINVEKLNGVMPSIDYMTWRNLEQNLPLLAGQMLESGKVTVEARPSFEAMSDPKWWQRNVVPTYALTKADTKALMGISKELQESEATTILNLVISARQRSREAIDAKLKLAADFIQQGAAYIALRSLVNGYQSEAQSEGVALQKKISATEVELKYLRERASKLESLRKRFPLSTAVNGQQVVDVKDSSAKFMPVVTQLVAAYSDIDHAEELLVRARAQLAQYDTKREFLAAALPAVAEEMDGLKLAERLIGIETSVRRKIAATDVERMQILDSLRAEVTSIRTRFARGLTKNAATPTAKSSPVLPALGGFAGAGLLALLGLVVRRGWTRYRAARYSNVSVGSATGL